MLVEICSVLTEPECPASCSYKPHTWPPVVWTRWIRSIPPLPPTYILTSSAHVDYFQVSQLYSPFKDHDHLYTLFLFFMGVRLRLWTAVTNGHIVLSPRYMSLESDGGMILTGEDGRTRRKTCSNATLSTTNPTWIDLGANPCLRGEKPATNCLSHARPGQLYTICISPLMSSSSMSHPAHSPWFPHCNNNLRRQYKLWISSCACINWPAWFSLLGRNILLIALTSAPLNADQRPWFILIWNNA
jgi:hypothetical protein